MSILDAFDNASPEILRPADLSPVIPGLPETVLSVFSQKTIDAALRAFPAEQIGEIHFGFTIPVYKIRYEGHEAALYLSVIGGAGTAALMEKLIVNGAKNFVFYGSCGVLSKDLPAGQLIVPTHARRDEGVSYHYAPADDFIPVVTAPCLSSILSDMGIPHISGKTWTTDAIFRETENQVHRRKKEGCIAADMECASIMALSDFRGVNAYQFFYAEDNLDTTKWDRRTLGNLPDDDREAYTRIALKIAARL